MYIAQSSKWHVHRLSASFVHLNLVPGVVAATPFFSRFTMGVTKTIIKAGRLGPHSYSNGNYPQMTERLRWVNDFGNMLIYTDDCWDIP